MIKVKVGVSLDMEIIVLVSGVVYAGCVQGDGYCSLRTSLATQ